MNIDPRLYTFGLALAAYGHIYALPPAPVGLRADPRPNYAEQIERPGTRRLVRSLS
jgi:hypothetical protein